MDEKMNNFIDIINAEENVERMKPTTEDLLNKSLELLKMSKDDLSKLAAMTRTAKAIKDLNDSFKSFCRENRCTGGCPIKTYKENNKLEGAKCVSVYLIFKLKEKGIF